MVKYMDLNEFVDHGYLQEVNRQFFHPLGLALEICLNEDDSAFSLRGMRDARDDEEGWIFSDLSNSESLRKKEYIEKIQKERGKIRQEKLGYVIQPVGE